MNIIYKKQNKININIMNIFFLVVLIPLTLPDYFQEYEFFKVLSSFIIISIFFIVIIFFIIIYFLWRSLTSYFYSDNVLDLTNSVKVITLALFINVTIKKYTRSILFSLSILFSIYIYINFMSIYLFPNGLYIVDRPSS